MTYYHRNKAAAQAAGEQIADQDWRFRSEFVPQNGYVVVLMPTKFMLQRILRREVDLLPLLEVAEIELPRLKLLPVGHKSITPPPPPPTVAKRPVVSVAVGTVKPAWE